MNKWKVKDDGSPPYLLQRRKYIFFWETVIEFSSLDHAMLELCIRVESQKCTRGKTWWPR